MDELHAFVAETQRQRAMKRSRAFVEMQSPHRSDAGNRPARVTVEPRHAVRALLGDESPIVRRRHDPVLPETRVEVPAWQVDARLGGVPCIDRQDRRFGGGLDAQVPAGSFQLSGQRRPGNAYAHDATGDAVVPFLHFRSRARNVERVRSPCKGIVRQRRRWHRHGSSHTHVNFFLRLRMTCGRLPP